MKNNFYYLSIEFSLLKITHQYHCNQHLSQEENLKIHQLNLVCHFLLHSLFVKFFIIICLNLKIFEYYLFKRIKLLTFLEAVRIEYESKSKLLYV